MIVHVPACEQQNQNQAYHCPKVSVLDDWKDIWVCNGAESEQADNDRDDSDQLGPVERSSELRMVPRNVSLEPAVNALCCLLTEEIEANWLSIT